MNPMLFMVLRTWEGKFRKMPPIWLQRKEAVSPTNLGQRWADKNGWN